MYVKKNRLIMVRRLTGIIPFLITMASCGQDVKCNKTVEYAFLAKKIPKEVCLPEGHQITRLYKNTDVNNDGFKDLIFDWSKINLKDGDTLYISIYNQLKDSTFVLFRTFSNLKPLYFKRYNFEYQVKDSMLNEIKSRYNEQIPPYRLEFKNDIIYMSFIIGAPFVTLNQYYQYKKDTWYLVKEEIWDESGEHIQKEKILDFEQVKIDDFNYLNYLD